MEKSKPIIAVGIDVASPEFIEKWIRESHLPTISSLLNRGSWGRIHSVSDISSGSIWPTFFTGVSPAKHGQFFTHMQFTNGTYQIDKKYADQVKRDPFWFQLNRAGKRIAILDVPQTYPLKGLKVSRLQVGVQSTQRGRGHRGLLSSSMTLYRVLESTPLLTSTDYQ